MRNYYISKICRTNYCRFKVYMAIYKTWNYIFSFSINCFYSTIIANTYYVAIFNCNISFFKLFSKDIEIFCILNN